MPAGHAKRQGSLSSPLMPLPWAPSVQQIHAYASRPALSLPLAPGHRTQKFHPLKQNCHKSPSRPFLSPFFRPFCGVFISPQKSFRDLTTWCHSTYHLSPYRNNCTILSNRSLARLKRRASVFRPGCGVAVFRPISPDHSGRLITRAT